MAPMVTPMPGRLRQRVAVVAMAGCGRSEAAVVVMTVTPARSGGLDGVVTASHNRGCMMVMVTVVRRLRPSGGGMVTPVVVAGRLRGRGGVVMAPMMNGRRGRGGCSVVTVMVMADGGLGGRPGADQQPGQRQTQGKKVASHASGVPVVGRPPPRHGR